MFRFTNNLWRTIYYEFFKMLNLLLEIITIYSSIMYMKQLISVLCYQSNFYFYLITFFYNKIMDLFSYMLPFLFFKNIHTTDNDLMSPKTSLHKARFINS